jgi:complex iron-sulfur molybdoenzyme family reductase subunit gamma
VLSAIAIALVVGALDVLPVRSQALRLEALRATSSVPLGDPWDAVWDEAPRQDVALSQQNIAPPFGGGTIDALVTRALHDGDRLYLLLEWDDEDLDDAVNGAAEFSDAIAVQFPAASVDVLPPFTMGSPSAPVNIWQWRAVWQADIDSGFTTLQDRYPNTLVDFFPGADDPLFRTAQHVGNPLAQREHDSPIENLIAAGFGTLTHAEVQDVAGSGAWREGRWRALFARQLEPAAEDQASFAVGDSTNVAFAVWDGSSGDRNGQKSIATFIELAVGPGEASAASDSGGAQLLIALVIGLTLLAGVAFGAFQYTRVQGGGGRGAS